MVRHPRCTSLLDGPANSAPDKPDIEAEFVTQAEMRVGVSDELNLAGLDAAFAAWDGIAVGAGAGMMEESADSLRHFGA